MDCHLIKPDKAIITAQKNGAALCMGHTVFDSYFLIIETNSF